MGFVLIHLLYGGLQYCSLSLFVLPDWGEECVAQMDKSLELVNGAVFLVVSTWVPFDIMKQRREEGPAADTSLKPNKSTERRSPLVIILYNAVLSFSYVSLCICELWYHRTVRLKSAFHAMSWVMVSVYTVLARNRVLKEDKGWPLGLVFWWVFSCIRSLLFFSAFLVSHIKARSFPPSLTITDVVNIITLLVSVLLCIRGLRGTCSKQECSDFEHPLLESVAEDSGGAFANAGIWSQLTFQWLNPLFKKGRFKKLELSHVPSIPPSETADEASFLLEASLRAQKTGVSSLPKAIFDAIWRPLAINAVFAGLNTMTSYMGPFLIKDFVNFINGDHDYSSYQHGLILSFIFLIAKTVESLSQRQWYFGGQRIGIRTRAGLMVLIYKKSLSMKDTGLSSGKITNLINVDVERIGEFFSQIHQVWLLPLQVTLALIILHQNLGAVPSFAALSATIFVMVINTPLANMQEELHSKIMDAKDSRIKATSETLKNMRVLKLHSWESRFLHKLLQLREIERGWLKKYLYTCSAVAFLFWASPTLISVVTFGVCILMKTPLTAGTVLSALATFRILQEPVYNLPELVSVIAQTKVSLDRIQGFLKEEDQMRSQVPQISKASDVSVELEPGEYAWEANDWNSRKPTVKLTNKLNILKGQKIAICGSVGSGKSSLLCSILGEIPRISGSHIKVHGSKAYVPQSSWIQTGNIRENVLFGKQMNAAVYGDVIEGCALGPDIEAWADGDLTSVGERGLNLSGGQKQRIQLARAVYSDAEVYFLDDPFSAVDAHTGAHLFKKCLMELLAQKTVLYATHQLEFLEASDLVLVMEDGKIVEFGKYRDLISNPDGQLVRQMKEHKKSLNEVGPTKIRASKGKCKQEDSCEVTEEKFEESSKKYSEMCHEEETEAGRVKWRVYSTFVTSAYRGALVPVILLCQVLFQGLQMGSNYWITWATEKPGRVSSKQLIAIFALLSGGSSIFVLGRTVFLSTIAIETAQRLFLGMINSVFRAPVSFFDSTPSSRILSRASTDQGTIDMDIPYRLAGLAFALIQLFSIIVLMSQVAWPIFLIFVAVLAISMWYQAYYISTARELARMVGIRKAPIVHHFSESITGVATIRCFNQEERFFRKNLGLIDDYSRIVFHNTAAMEWLCARINFLFNLVFFVLLAILVRLPKSALNPSLAGLAATYGLNMNVLQGWVIWNLCNVENKMISVERVLQFSNLRSEAPLVVEDCRPQTEWPTEGRVELENLQVQYRPSLPLILKGITCTFPGEKKVGVVGRTGSGKSTLIQALFRMVEPSEGRILIDGLDIRNMGLHDLRSRLSIIPQDPTLFQGTMRMNVDPLQEHSDQEIWEVLSKCRLADIVKEDQRLLDAPVAEDGHNWSVGQRQLVCLARVLLQKRKILVLDEATASVDTATDNVIQKTIREETDKCTVISIAHRIPTVVDNDLVLVLDEGNIVEYDSPDQLLRNSSSAFSKLVVEFLNRSSGRSQS